MKILKTNGNWSLKRIIAVIAFSLACLYEFIAMIWEKPSKEYVFEGLLTFAGLVIIGTIVDKKMKNKNLPGDEQPE